MKFVLIGGSDSHFKGKNLFSRFLESENCRNLLIIANQSDKDPRHKFMGTKEMLLTDRDLRKYDIELFDVEKYKKGEVDFFDYDAIYMTGGYYSILKKAVDGTNFFKEIRNWIKFSYSRLYFGASLGAQLLGRHFFDDDEELSNYDDYIDESFKIFPGIVFEPHFTEWSGENRAKDIIEKSDEVDAVIGIDEKCAILIDDNNPMKPEILHGSSHIFRKF